MILHYINFRYLSRLSIYLSSSSSRFTSDHEHAPSWNLVVSSRCLQCFRSCLSVFPCRVEAKIKSLHISASRVRSHQPGITRLATWHDVPYSVNILGSRAVSVCDKVFSYIFKCGKHKQLVQLVDNFYVKCIYVFLVYFVAYSVYSPPMVSKQTGKQNTLSGRTHV